MSKSGQDDMMGEKGGIEVKNGELVISISCAHARASDKNEEAGKGSTSPCVSTSVNACGDCKAVPAFIADAIVFAYRVGLAHWISGGQH